MSFIEQLFDAAIFARRKFRMRRRGALAVLAALLAR
jgi:hypothetical protein